MTRIAFPLQGDDVVTVTVASRGERGILAAYAAAENFPEYYTGNFDSLAACIADLLGEGRSLIVLHLLPMAGADRHLATYRRVLSPYAADPRVAIIERGESSA